MTLARVSFVFYLEALPWGVTTSLFTDICLMFVMVHVQ